MKKFSYSIQDVMDIAVKKAKSRGLNFNPHVWERAINGSIVSDGVTKMFVSELEVDEYAEDYEQKTGKCFNCKGTGETFVSWHFETGTKTGKCARCGGLWAV